MARPPQVGRWEGGDCEGVLVFGPASECWWPPEARKELHDDVPLPEDLKVLCITVTVTDITMAALWERKEGWV